MQPPIRQTCRPTLIISIFLETSMTKVYSHKILNLYPTTLTPWTLLKLSLSFLIAHGKTSFFWSIITWNIACLIIIILCILMCYFIFSYQYFYTTFLSALKITTRQHLRAFLIKIFFNHTNNPNPEIQA